MKRIIAYFSIVALAAFAASCNLNDNPVFNDDDAFVAFDKASVSCNETAGEISIPVTLASVQGIATTISYEAVDGTAKAGTNFDLVDGTGTLTFSATERTQLIKVKIYDPEVTYDDDGEREGGKYTGDLKFTLKFKSTGSVNAGVENSCVVTIADLDHPLSFILGTYSGSADSYFSSRGHFDWTFSVDKDADDPTMVWIGNLDPYFGSYGYVAPNYNYFFGNVNEERTQITIPRGQKIGYDDCALVGFTGYDPDESGLGDVVITISEDGKTLTLPNGWGIAVDANGESWYNLFYGGIVFTKD